MPYYINRKKTNFRVRKVLDFFGFFCWRMYETKKFNTH